MHGRLALPTVEARRYVVVFLPVTRLTLNIQSKGKVSQQPNLSTGMRGRAQNSKQGKFYDEQPSTAVSTRSLAALWTMALALALALGWWAQRGLSVHLIDVSSLKVPCLSYAPFRREGATPTQIGADITPAQIEEDLKLIKDLTPCIRTYGVSKGLAAVPEVAAKLGMRVRLGVWLSRDLKANQMEMETALALTHKYRANIDALIVGNEVLLREDLAPAALGVHLKDAKARSAVPVTYADVWEFWRRQRPLAQYVDIVTIHVLPYWEDEPVSAALASQHVFNIFHQMRAEFSGIPIWIGESGWPAAGRQRAGAVPGVVTQTQVLREVMERATKEGVDMNLIEAFDQPWKRSLEGGMGGAWGFFRADGSLRMSFKGPVTEDVYWWRGIFCALVSGLAGWAVYRRASSMPKFGRTLGLALIGAVAPAHIDAMFLWSRDMNEWFVAISATLVVLLGSLALLFDLTRDASLGGKTSVQSRLWLDRMLRFALLGIAIAWAWYLWIDPRYRGFPIALFYPSAVFSAALLIRRLPIHWPGLRPLLGTSLWLGLSCSLGYLATMIMRNEEISNTQALTIGTLWLLIALAQSLAYYPAPPAKAS
jgi:exo-beta-1,3-glucanase (GH17 family)